MYPKVKVREQQDYDDQYDFEARSLQSLKALECLSLDDFSSSDDSPRSVVRVPRLDSSNSASPSVSVHKEATSSSRQRVLEEKTTNIRASPVLRPRAVLSSPDNDAKIGSKSKRYELLSGLKDHNHCQNRHIHHKFITKPLAADVSLPTRRELKEVADTKRGRAAARQRKVSFDPSLPVRLRNGKS